MIRTVYIEFLKGLRKGLDLSTADHAEVSKISLDKMIANASMDPAAEETKKRDQKWDELKIAALEGRQVMVPVYAEDGTKTGETLVSAKAEVTKIFVTRINNFIRPMTSALEFFSINTLADNEIPYIQNESQHDYKVALIDEDGGHRGAHVLKAQSQAQVELHVLSTEKVRYMIMDLLRGNVANEHKKLIDIAGDLALNLDRRLWTSLQAPSVLGAFTTTGKAQNRTYHPHSSIFTANLPSTNVLSSTASGGIDKEVLDVIFQYAAKWAGVFSDGDLYPTTIFFPSSVNLGILGDVQITTQENSLNKQIITRGFIHNYLGRDISYRPLATLDPAGKKAYVKFNKPVGEFYEKPGMDKVFNKEDEEENEGSMRSRKVWGATIPRPRTTNIVSVQYVV